jgi:hypothetical protein
MITCCRPPIRIAPKHFNDITFGNKNLLSLLAHASLLRRMWRIISSGRSVAVRGPSISAAALMCVYPIVLHSEALARVKALTGSCLLPIAYRSGADPSFLSRGTCR